MGTIGHSRQINFLNKSLEKNIISQAYIFSGPDGLGKFDIAKKFSESLVDGKGVMEFSSGKVYHNIFTLEPKVDEKKGVKKERDIKIEDVRDTLKKLAVFPMNGKYNILIIDKAHRLTKSAQNALLKTLEEPNSTSIIILVVNNENEIINTIKSRCQIVRFGLIPVQEIASQLRDMGKSEIQEMAVFSMGRPRLVFEMLSDNELFEQAKKGYADLREVSSLDIFERMNKADEYSKDVLELIRRLELWIWFLRIQGYKSMYDERKLKMIYDKINRINIAIDKIRKSSANAKLILENLLVSL